MYCSATNASLGLRALRDRRRARGRREHRAIGGVQDEGPRTEADIDLVGVDDGGRAVPAWNLPAASAKKN